MRAKFRPPNRPQAGFLSSEIIAGAVEVTDLSRVILSDEPIASLDLESRAS
ncbi:MAG: hypothetical protein ACREF9_13125 [Opitutaceae bacterium]